MPRNLGAGATALALALAALDASAADAPAVPASDATVVAQADASPAATPPPAAAPADDSVKLDKIQVTGSRIPRSQIEGPAPVTILSRDQIDRAGYTTVSEALNSLTQISTQFQNEQFTNSFTPNARGADLRGLGPGRTLILLDGRRLPDYPLPYNSQSNLVSLTGIPTSIVDRIEVLTGGASAIYGADAIAGVINIILKKDYSGMDVDVRAGTTTQGGGDSQRIQVSGGMVRNDLSVSYALEFFNRDTLYDFERNNTDSTSDNPNPALHFNSRDLLLLDPLDQDDDGLTYVDPGAAACAGFESLVYSFRPGRGFYCGSDHDVADESIRSGQRNYSGLVNFNYKLSSSLNAYGYVNYSHTTGVSSNGPSFFSGNNGDFILDTNGPDVFGIGGQVLTVQKIYSRDEGSGKPDYWASKPKEHTIGLSGGLNGMLTDTWRWDGNLTWYKSYAKPRARYALTDAVTDYLMGPNMGTDPNFGLPMYALDRDRFYTPFTKDQMAAFTQRESTKGDSDVTEAQFTVNGDLMQLPAGPLAMAGVIEFEHQGYDLKYDSNYASDNYFPAGERNSSDGKRKRYAAGVEFSVPIFEQLTGMAAARYDDYDDRSSVSGEFTYNLGLEYRPFSTVLFRTTYAKTFRAPDMYFLFAPQESFFFSTPDYYLCRRDEPDTDPQGDCSNANVNPEGQRSTADADLKAETGHTLTVGAVWDILPKLNVHADYFDIKLDEVVNDRSLDEILRTEADCRLGEDTEGNPVDAGSAKCQDAIARVHRRPADGTLSSEAIDVVVTSPINQSLLRVKGIDAGIGYDLAAGAFGKWHTDLSWTHVLKNPQRQFADDPIVDQRDSPTNWETRSRMTAQIRWQIVDFDSTLSAVRTGSVPHGDPVNFIIGEGRTNAQTIFNLNVVNNVTRMVSVGLTVDNLFDKGPPHDDVETVFPYYNYINYSNVGREVFLSLHVKLW